MSNSTGSTMAATCPACGGTLQFDPTTGKLKCEYCGSTYTPEEAEAAWKEKEKNAAAAGEAPTIEWDGEAMKTYGCSTCGAELIANETTAVMICPYCGNQTIAPAQFSGAIRPDHLIPFAHTKDQAIEKYKSYYEKRLLLPKSFKTDSHVSDIQGVYVPFWLFSGKASIDAKYEATDTRRIDDKTKEVSYYDVWRKGTLSYENVPTDASERMPDDLMDSIEPYKMNEMKDFSLSYLPGFLAERFDVDEEKNRDRAESRIRNTVSSETKKTVRHQDVDVKNASDEQIDLERGKTSYALFPVWLLVTKWNEKEYKFAMNGQTGKMIGDLPISVPKFLTVFLAVLVGVMLLCLLFLEPGYAVLAGVIAAAIVGVVMYTSMKPVANASDADEYISEPLALTYEHEEFKGKKKVRT